MLYLLKLRKLFVSLASLPFVVAETYLNNVFSVWFTTLVRLLNDCLADSYVDVLFVNIRLSLLPHRGQVSEALLEMQAKRICLYPFTAIGALH